MDKKEVVKKDYKELEKSEYNQSELSKDKNKDTIKKEIKKNTSSVEDSLNEIQVINEKKQVKTYKKNKSSAQTKVGVKSKNNNNISKKEAYVNHRSNTSNTKTVKKRTSTLPTNSESKKKNKIYNNNKENTINEENKINKAIKINKDSRNVKAKKVIKDNNTINDSNVIKDNKTVKSTKFNIGNKEKSINKDNKKIHNNINSSIVGQNCENTDGVESKQKQDITNVNKKSKLEFISKTIHKKESVSNDKVTDFKDVQRAAIANEKRKKKQERINCIKERIEQLKTPKAKAGITIILLVIIFLTFSALTIINDVQVDEGKHYTKDEIKKFVIKNIFDYNSVYLFLKYRYSEQESIPFVEYIDVDWIDKNTVRLKVYDKNIIGCTNFMNEYVYFDKDGYVVETSSKKENNIPYITGINFEELTLNSRIKVDDEEIFETILSITQQVSKYKLDIDEINFDNNYNLTLYVGNITVLLGKQETYDEQLAKLKSMLDEAKKENLSGILHMEKYKEGQDRIIFDKK